MADIFDEIDSGSAVDVFDELSPDQKDIFDDIEPEVVPKAPSLQPPEPAPIAPTFESPISITEEGPLYKREQEEAVKAAALYAPPTPVQPPSLAPVREAEVPKLFKPEHIPRTGIPLTAAEKALGPSEQTKKEQAQLEIYRQAVDLASQQSQRDLTNAELAKIGEDAARAVDFFGAIQRIPDTAQKVIGALGTPVIAAGEGSAAIAYGQGLNRLAEDVAAGDLNFPRFRSAVGRTQAGVGFSPLEKGGVELASLAPDIALTGVGQYLGVPAPVTFGTLSAARAAAQGATLPQTLLAGATGALAPGAGQLGTKGAAIILKGAVNRGLLSANRETALKALESLGGQAGFQTFFAGMSLPEIAELPPEKRWDFFKEGMVKNFAFFALDIPKFRRGVPSETRKAIVSDFLDMMARQGPMGSVLKAPAERGVPVSLGTEVEAKVPVSANPETISSNLGLEFLGTTKTTDRYVYNGINPRTGRPAGITVSVPQGTGERGVSEKMQSRLAEYEMAQKKEAASPEGITIPEKLKLREGEEIRLTISEQQDYQDYIRRGFTPEQSLEMALTISGRTTTPVKPQMIKGTVPEPSLKSFRTGEFKGVPMAEDAMWDFLTKRYGIGKGNLVQIVEKPDSMESGELLYNPTTRQPIRIVLNRSQISTNGELFDVLQHEAAHWYDLANPGRAKYLVGTLAGEEIKSIEDAIKKLPYSWNELPEERTAKVIQKLANEWSKRSWFQSLTDEIRIFANRTIGIKLTRRAAQTVAVRAIAGSLKAAREPAPKTPTSRWTEQTLPTLVPGDRLVSVERPDGTRYVASYNPEKSYDLREVGGGIIAQIGKPVGDSWSHTPIAKGEKIIEDAGKSGLEQTERTEALLSQKKPEEEATPPAVSEKAAAAESEFRRIEEQQERIEAQRGKPTQALPSAWETMVGKITKGQRDKLLETIQSQPYGLKIQHELLKIADTIDRDNFDLRLKQAIRSAGRSLQPIEVETQIVPESAVSEKAMGAAAPELSVGPGASSPAEFTQRQAGANRRPPPPNPPVTIEPGQSAAPEVVRQSKDYNLFNRINSGQWLFYFGRLGEAAKQAFEKSALAEYFMRESVMRDVRTFVRGTLKELPSSARKQGGKAFFDVLDGKTMDQIRSEWEGRPNGETIIAQAEKVKTRLEEIRTTIRDTKRDSFNRYLNAMNKDALVDLFRENINREIDISNMTKEDLANALTMDQFPDDWGISDGSYLPHLFFGQWKVTVRMPGAEGAQFITRSQTIQEAKARIYEQTKANPELRNAHFTIEQDTVIPADMIRLGDRRFWALVSKMREQNMTQAEVRDALRGNIGRKAGKEKWFGSLKERKGFEGYSKDYARTMTAYLNGFHRWKVLTQLNREVQPLIEQVRREGRINAAQRLEQLVDNLWGKPQASTKQFDAFVRQIPGVRDFIKPMALDRWARAATNLTGLLTLRTLRFSVVNRLQPLQTLYPLIGERGIIEAKIMQHTDQGRALLREAGVDLDPGQYAGEFGVGLRGREFVERFSGERSNQEVAFLGMYNHARKMGMSHQDAINYGKLRGQLMTQFTPLTVDTPELFEGPFGRLMFQYKRFPVKTIELASRMAADRNVPAIARMVGVLATLGGISYFLRQTWFTDPDTRLRIKRGLDKELGTRAADTMMYGLPGFLGADISGSITLGDEPIGRGIYEKGARALTGPAVSLGIEAGRVLTTPKRKETTGIQQTETFLRRFPATRPLAELSAMLRGDIDIRTPDGETKLKRKLTDAIAGLGSFRSANEANIALAVNGIMELAKEEARLKNDYFVAPNKTEALKQILNFNRMWPEAAITPEDLDRYSKYRTTAAKQTDVSRIAGKRFERLIPQEQRVPR